MMSPTLRLGGSSLDFGRGDWITAGLVSGSQTASLVDDARAPKERLVFSRGQPVEELDELFVVVGMGLAAGEGHETHHNPERGTK